MQNPEKFGEVWTWSSGDILADRQTDTQTHTYSHTHIQSHTHTHTHTHTLKTDTPITICRNVVYSVTFEVIVKCS